MKCDGLLLFGIVFLVLSLAGKVIIGLTMIQNQDWKISTLWFWGWSLEVTLLVLDFMAFMGVFLRMKWLLSSEKARQNEEELKYKFFE